MSELSPSLPSSNPHRHHRIAFVSDFFYPRLGGVELHQYNVAQALRLRGHHVIIITNTYSGGRQHVRYLSGGLKVYHLPLIPIAAQTTLPTLFTSAPILRHIFVRERIGIVHAHQSTSALAHEALVTAQSVGCRTVYTDHSLFSFASVASVLLNALMTCTLCNADAVITVSHTSRENITLRARVHPRIVYVIPNAIDSAKLTPKLVGGSGDGAVRIVIISRLVYRKGLDLVAQIIPPICAAHPNVRFIIGGDGPKRLLLQEMIAHHALHERVELLGELAHSQVHDTLLRGDIFLNCSLTEAFCIALLEAISVGLITVATSVGGVTELLPENLIIFAQPTVADIIRAVTAAVARVGTVDPNVLHEEVKRAYNWHNVAARTERVYDQIERRPKRTIIERTKRIVRRYDRHEDFISAPACVVDNTDDSDDDSAQHRRCGVSRLAGIFFAIFYLINAITLCLAEILDGADEIESAVDYPKQQTQKTHAETADVR